MAFAGWPLFASKQPLARIDFLRRVGDWWAKKALIMLKNKPKIVQKNRKRLFVGGVLGCKPIGTETGTGGEMVDVVFKHRGKDPLCVQAFVRDGHCRCAELPHGGALRFMPNPRLQKEISQRHGEPCNWERCLDYPLQAPNFGRTGVSGAWMMAVSLACDQVAAFIRP